MLSKCWQLTNHKVVAPDKEPEWVQIEEYQVMKIMRHPQSKILSYVRHCLYVILYLIAC